MANRNQNRIRNQNIIRNQNRIRNQNINYYNNNNNNEHNNIEARINAIMMNNSNGAELVKVALPEGAPTECFDPIMGNATVKISGDMTTFYTMDESNNIVSASCLDEDSLEQYKTSKNFLFFRCKDTVPVSALQITPENVNPGAIRLLNFEIRIYVKNAQAQQLQHGKKYILKPVGELERIVSHDVLTGGTLVGAVHCGPADGSKLYDIQEVIESEGGRRRRSKKTRGQRRKRRATRKNLKRYLRKIVR